MSDASKTYTEFTFCGTPAESDAMHEALRRYVERGDVKIALAMGENLSPLEVAQTIRVLETSKHHDDACELVRELLAGDKTSS